MLRSRSRRDPVLIALLAIFVIGGSLLFSSAALGLLARGATHVSSVVFNHLILGIGAGLVLLVGASIFDYRKLRPLAPYIFGAGLIFTAFVFLPVIGMEHGGGRRWLDLHFLTVQPSEFLKFASVVLAASIFATLREQTGTLRGLGYFLGIIAGPTLLLLLQPDLGTLGIIIFSVLAIFIAGGARFRDIGIIALCAGLALFALSCTSKYAYVYDRIETFFKPHDQSALVEGYQIRQSLIAIGSGGIWGRGLGQSIQKFTYLPEPMGDSIFAVAGEELGFIGATGIILLFLMLGLRGYSTASHSSDLFGGLLAVGISTYLVGEAFINIAAMLGVAPLTGVPLTFISQGGSAMIASLASAGILLNISKRIVKK